MSEDRHIDTNELVDYLCWKFAWEGDRFHPPRDTAKECVEAINDGEGTWYGEELELEVGQHARAWTTAVDFFEDLEAEGYDPVMRTRRHIERSELDLEEPDWEWLSESHYGGDIQ